MSLFSLSQQGKKAQGTMQEMPYWLWDQAKDQWGWGNDQQGQLTQQQQQLNALLQQIMMGEGGTGFDPNTLNALGDLIMPGVGDAQQGMKTRAQQLRDLYSNFTNKYGADKTYDDVSGTIDEYGSSINRTGDQTGDLISGFDKWAQGYADDQYGNIDKDIYGSYDAVGKESGAAFDAASGRSQSLIDELKSGVMDPHDVGDFSAARVSRSFNPALASTAMRLRRGGVSDTSPEAGAALSRVYAARARAANDAYADESRYQDARRNELFDKRSGLTSDLNQFGLGKAMNSQSLGLGRLGATTGNSMNRMGTKMGVAEGTRNANISNLNTTQNRLGDYYGQVAGNKMARRTNASQDFGGFASLNDRDTQDMLTGFGLGQQKWNMASQSQQQQNAAKTGAGQQMFDNTGNLMSQYYNRGDRLYTPAYQGVGNTYKQEAATSGWLGKLLAGMAGPALSAFTGGLAGGAGKLGGKLGSFLGSSKGVSDSGDW